MKDRRPPRRRRSEPYGAVPVWVKDGIVCLADRAWEIGIERCGAQEMRRTCSKLCRNADGNLKQIKFLLGHFRIQTIERSLGSEREIAVAVNDSLGP